MVSQVTKAKCDKLYGLPNPTRGWDCKELHWPSQANLEGKAAAGIETAFLTSRH